MELPKLKPISIPGIGRRAAPIGLRLQEDMFRERSAAEGSCSIFG